MYDVAIVGGGIVGLATALSLSARDPGARIVVLEKEPHVADHQTGHNSGVIHSGLYYRPGSLKAEMCRVGNFSMVAFCERHDIPVEVCGKVVVATEPSELPRLEALYARGLANGLTVRKLTPTEVQEHEPHVRCLGGIFVASTGIVDYVRVSRTYADIFEARGGTLLCGVEVLGFHETSKGLRLKSTRGTLEAKFVVNCAGLFSDRVARLGGAEPNVQIVPFRGEYYELIPERRHLVRNLIYPVPNPDFPFLGVHFTRMVDGSVHAGPNAVLGLKREGYRKRDIDLRDLAETLLYPGFWKLASKYTAEGLREVVRSWSKAAFVRSLQRLIPEVRASDVVPAGAGVRAQALQADGGLVDDFLIIERPQSLHVCNAPSPAATASLEIAKAIVQKIPKFGVRQTTSGWASQPSEAASQPFMSYQEEL